MATGWQALDLSDRTTFRALVARATHEAWAYLQEHWPHDMPSHGEFALIAAECADNLIMESTALSREAIQQSVAAALSGADAGQTMMMPPGVKQIVRNLYEFIFEEVITSQSIQYLKSEHRYPTPRPAPPHTISAIPAIPDEERPTVPMQAVRSVRQQRQQRRQQRHEEGA